MAAPATCPERHLIDLAGDLQARGVDLVVLQQAIDTATPGGRLGGLRVG